jgi:hypothetical protein
MLAQTRKRSAVPSIWASSLRGYTLVCRGG